MSYKQAQHRITFMMAMLFLLPFFILFVGGMRAKEKPQTRQPDADQFRQMARRNWLY